MAQENRHISAPQAALPGASSDDLSNAATETLPPPETAPETALETVSASISASDRVNRSTSTPRLRQSPFRRRLPRFHRAKKSHRPPIALQDRDLEILRTVFEYRLISTPQFLRLFADESRDGIYRRLQKLFHHDYLDRIGTNPNAPLVYALARQGGEVLGVTTSREPGDRYVDHQLMIGDFRVALALAARQEGIDLSWRPLSRHLPVLADGFFGLRFPDRPEGANRAYFFLEADRSTMPRGRFIEKLFNYQRWYFSGGHTEALGIKSFRVLTVTKSEARRRSLLEAVAAEPQLAPRHASYWFGHLSGSVIEGGVTLSAPIWQSAAEPALGRSILPAAGT